MNDHNFDNIDEEIDLILENLEAGFTFDFEFEDDDSEVLFTPES